MPLRTPLKNVRGLGAAREGAGHFWWQRLTGFANIWLTLALAAIAIGSINASYDEAREMVASPLVAITLLLFVLSATYHMRLGMQVIVEDYIRGEFAKVVALALNTMVSIAVAVACAYAILKIGFGG